MGFLDGFWTVTTARDGSTFRDGAFGLGLSIATGIITVALLAWIIRSVRASG